MEEKLNQPLKGGEFLIKHSRPVDTFIPEELSEDALMMSEAVNDFVAKEIWPRLDEIDEKSYQIVPGLLEKAGELGLLGTSIPEEFGGSGLDFNTNTALTDAIGPSYAFGVSYSAHTGIGTLPILYYGTQEQKDKYLPGLASGKLKSAYCLTEPGSGSDALAAKTKAVLSDDGEHYIVNGQKMFITNGGFADIFIVFAKVDGKDFSCFIIDANSEGITRGEEEHKMGIKGSSTVQIFFENVKVPAENLLGKIGKGHKIAFNILNIGRFKLCAMVVGGCKQSITTGVKYANERHQFGHPISDFGAIKFKIAEQTIKTFACESATYRVSNLIKRKIGMLQEKGAAYHEALMEAAEEYAIECAILKVHGSEVLDYVVDETVQIHGGYGYSEEYPAARTYRDARINRIFEGTNEINRLLTIDMLLKKALKGDLKLMEPAMKIQRELMSIPEYSSDEETLLSKEWHALKQAKKAILMVAGSAAQKLMKELENEQEIMMNITDMMIEVFAAESALLRTLKLSTMKNEEDLKPYVYMTQVLTGNALEQVYLHGKHAIMSFVEGDELRLMMLGLKRFTKFNAMNYKNLRREVANRVIEENKYCF
jgi:alkylation response protein AidB-like acyl-CoA dehydrogenase